MGLELWRLIFNSTLLCYIYWSSGYWNIDDWHRNPNVNIRENIWLGNQLVPCQIPKNPRDFNPGIPVSHRGLPKRTVYWSPPPLQARASTKHHSPQETVYFRGKYVLGPNFGGEHILFYNIVNISGCSVVLTGIVTFENDSQLCGIRYWGWCSWWRSDCGRL